MVILVLTKGRLVQEQIHGAARRTVELRRSSVLIRPLHSHLGFHLRRSRRRSVGVSSASRKSNISSDFRTTSKVDFQQKTSHAVSHFCGRAIANHLMDLEASLPDLLELHPSVLDLPSLSVGQEKYGNQGPPLTEDLKTSEQIDVLLVRPLDVSVAVFHLQLLIPTFADMNNNNCCIFSILTF